MRIMTRMVYLDLIDKLKYTKSLSYADIKQLFNNECRSERRIDDYGVVYSIFEVNGVYYKMRWFAYDEDFEFEQPYEVELIPASESSLRAWVEK